jgi:hypothetical protein
MDVMCLLQIAICVQYIITEKIPQEAKDCRDGLWNVCSVCKNSPMSVYT